MIFLMCAMLTGQVLETDDILYRIILPGMVYVDYDLEDNDWYGLFRVDCDHFMLRPVELQLTPEEDARLVEEGVLPAP